jgi:sialate O-acetylesterase
MLIEDDKIIITFSSFDEGLIAKDGELKEFKIAGNNGIFVEANAKIQKNNKIVVWSDKVDEPVAVRYGWRRCPIGCNLFNTAGLPASPFRTDNYPLISKDNK